MIKEIHNLEQRHKNQAEKETYRALTLKRDQSKELMEHKERKEHNRVLQNRYKDGNKPGKFLANMLKKKKTKLYRENKKR